MGEKIARGGKGLWEESTKRDYVSRKKANLGGKKRAFLRAK